MKHTVKLSSLFSKEEILATKQSLQIKGGDDKRPRLAPPGRPNPGPRPNGMLATI